MPVLSGRSPRTGLACRRHKCMTCAARTLPPLSRRDCECPSGAPFSNEPDLHQTGTGFNYVPARKVDQHLSVLDYRFRNRRRSREFKAPSIGLGAGRMPTLEACDVGHMSRPDASRGWPLEHVARGQRLVIAGQLSSSCRVAATTHVALTLIWFWRDLCPQKCGKGSSLARKISTLTRPYLSRFRVLGRLFCPSTWPLEHLVVNPFRTASKSSCTTRATIRMP